MLSERAFSVIWNQLQHNSLRSAETSLSAFYTPGKPKINRRFTISNKID